MMKKWIAIVAFVLCFGWASAEAVTVDKIVAKVGTDVVTLSDVKSHLNHQTCNCGEQRYTLASRRTVLWEGRVN